MTSSGFSARSSDGLRLPAAQTIASATFDFPEPFGPTTTATPGSSLTSTWSGNDLKPRSLIERRNTRLQHDDLRGWQAVVSGGLYELLAGNAARASRAAFCSAAFFESPFPIPACSPSMTAAHVKERSCGGPSTSITE